LTSVGLSPDVYAESERPRPLGGGFPLASAMQRRIIGISDKQVISDIFRRISMFLGVTGAAVGVVYDRGQKIRVKQIARQIEKIQNGKNHEQSQHEDAECF